MNINKRLMFETVKKLFFKFFPISVFFYITFTKYFPRSSYIFIKTELFSNETNPINEKIESISRSRLRKKILYDLKFHSTSINWNKKCVIKLILNTEGKIIGYKFCNVFYPNYFTKLQNIKLVNKHKFMKKNRRYFLIILKHN